MSKQELDLLMQVPFFLHGGVLYATILVLIASITAEAQTPADILSYHGSSVVSNGVNASEQQLTLTNVQPGAFGKLFSTTITDVPDLSGIPSSTLPSGTDYTAAAGQVYAEPLVKTGVNITTGGFQGIHDVVFVATSMDSLFAIDADNGTILWKDSFLYNSAGNPNPLNSTIPVGVTAVPGGSGTETNSADVTPWIGVVSTPVIDGTNGFIYVAAKTREVQGGDQTHPHYVYTLHKVRLSDGFDTPAVIADTTLQTSDTTYTYNSGPFVVGTGPGSIMVAGESRIYFNAVRQMIRPALELYNGRIYIASASHGGNAPYHGWILTYDAGTLACNGAWNATPNSTEGGGGIWQGGGGVVIDPNGYIYFQTGNGDFDGDNTNNVVTGLDTNGFPVHGNYGDCFMKLAIDPTTTQDDQGTNKNGWGLVTADYFSPSDNHVLDAAGTDLGSGGSTILPNSAGSTTHPHLLVGGGEEGTLYLIDRDNMGRFGVTNHVVQEFDTAVNGLLSVPSYFAGRLYASPGYGGNEISWPLTNGAIDTVDRQSSPDSIATPGCSPYISASGANNGIVWTVDDGTSQLRAYEATNLNTEIWTSNLNVPNDSLGMAVKFSCPTPADGRVYVGTANSLVAYGPNGVPISTPVAPTNLNAIVTGSSTIDLTWIDNSTNEASFRIERSTDGINFTEIATVAANQTTYANLGLSPQTTYYYQVRAENLFDNLSYSAYTNVASATTPAAGSETPVYQYHFDDGTGTTTTDSAGGNDGTLIGSTLPAWMSPGRIGNADLSFSGDGLYDAQNESAVQVNTDLSPVLGQTSSILFWIKTTQTGNDVHYQAPAVTGVDALGGGNDINWGYIDGSGHIGVAVGDSGTVLSANPINDGQWHHIALTRDSIAGIVNVYVDGALSATGTLESGAKTSPFYLIGALSVLESNQNFLGANFFNGELDEVQIYNDVVGAGYIAALALPPAAPTNLVVTPVSGMELDLSWNDNASNETGYEVWSSVNGGPYSRIAQLPANSVSYANSNLAEGMAYSYFVRAVNPVGTSDSNIVNSVTPTPPAAPTNFAVSYLNSTEVDLQWTDNANNETAYQILRRTNSDPFVLLVSLPANSTSYHDTSVQAGTSYDYRVQAYNVAGTSNFAGLTATTPTLSQYQAYLAPYNLSDTSPTADPDHIGIPNLLAYAFNLNPTIFPATGLPVESVQNGCVAITFVERTPPTDLTYTVQVSGNLVVWNSGSAYTTSVSVTPIDAQTESVTVRDNTPIAPHAPRFIRVNVAQ